MGIGGDLPLRVVLRMLIDPETLPDGFQRSEYLFDNGFIDQIVHRKDIKDKLLQILSLLLKRAA